MQCVLPKNYLRIFNVNTSHRQIAEIGSLHHECAMCTTQNIQSGGIDLERRASFFEYERHIEVAERERIRQFDSFTLY